MVNLEKLLRQEEYESLDFKQQFHENNLKLLHDLLCLANAYIEEDRYLVFGITDDKKIIGVQSDSNRKKNANIQDLVRQANFNRNQIPLPEINSSNSDSKFSIPKDSFAYKIAKIFWQYHPINDALRIANIKLI
ncbi:MAG: RNA-binding domain-containing protein [Xenococcaceae cyanobacterium]